MIRINLLATDRKTEKKKAPSAPGALQLYLFLGLFAGGALFACGVLYWLKESAIKDLDAKIQLAEKRQRELQVIKKQVEEFQAKEKLLTEKINLIDRLKSEQQNGVHMLDEISKSLPDFVWLSTMDQTGPVIKFSGQSNSLASVADFIGNLTGKQEARKDSWFQRVDLDSTTENASVVSFSLTASFANPNPDAGKAPAAQAASPAPAPAPAPKK
jgi:type IV pilus assembly protein PilN